MVSIEEEDHHPVEAQAPQPDLQHLGAAVINPPRRSHHPARRRRRRRPGIRTDDLDRTGSTRLVHPLLTTRRPGFRASVALDLRGLGDGSKLYRRATGRWPSSASEMMPPQCVGAGCVIPGAVPRDAWGKDFSFEAVDGGLRIRSLGAPPDAPMEVFVPD